MGLDGELIGILREVVQFLECLREVKLPIALESIRDNLLVRSKDTLTMSMVERRWRGSASPEPYLDMNAAGPKGLLAASKTEAELQEYVRAEEHWPQKQQQQQQQQQQQHHYETFQMAESTSDSLSAANPETGRDRNKQEETEDMLMDIYASFSAAQAKSKCHKCGPLYRKEGKKLFVFEQYRTCWVGLVGLHLLIYGNDRDHRPCTILPIHGYMARAAPNAIPRDQRKSESAFEIFRPGSRTFQFVARTPQDMEQWVMKICELSGQEKNEIKERPKTLIAVAFESDDSRQDSISREERYQDVGSLLADKAVPEDSSIVVNVTNGDGETAAASPPDESPKQKVVEIANPPPPPLPARIPRRLPFLPVHGSSSSYQCPDEEEDDIYHKIEDLKDSIHCYGNVGKTFEAKSPGGDNRPEELATYDDVSARAKDENKFEEKPKKKKKSKTTRRSIDSRNETIYDDAISMSIALKTNNIAIIDEQDKLVPYDDAENLLSNVRSDKSPGTEKTEKTENTENTIEPVKSPQKKSFLDRVRNRKESPQKIEKKIKRTVAMASPASVQELATYDDVSNLTMAQETKQNFEAEDSEYTCPPPPRPFYVKPPMIVTDAFEQQEFYDDVSACREKYKDEDACKLDQRNPRKLNYVSGAGRVDADTFVPCESTGYSQQSFEDNEHYKTPRSEPNHHRKYSTADQQEELYDDVAILAEFTARQKEVLGKRDGEDAPKIQAGLEKRSRNRFVRGFEDADDFDEQHGLMRMNTFQKLINKMENSFGKASVKIAPSMLLNKTNVTNDA